MITSDAPVANTEAYTQPMRWLLIYTISISKIELSHMKKIYETKG